MTLKNELSEIDGPKLREAFSDYWVRVSESGEDAVAAEKALVKDYPALVGLANHIEDDMKESGASAEDARKYAMGAALAMVGLRRVYRAVEFGRRCRRLSLVFCVPLRTLYVVHK